MALNTRSAVDPRWINHHSSVEDGLALAYIEIFKPNNASKEYNASTNTWTTENTVLYKGWARVQPNRPFTTFDSSNDFVPASAKDVAVFFNIHKNEADGYTGGIVDIRPGYEMKIVSAPNDEQMVNFKYTVKSVVNSSNTWSRGIVCEVNQELKPNYA